MQSIIEQLKQIEYSFPICILNIRAKAIDEDSALLSILMSVKLAEPISNLSKHVLIAYIRQASFKAGYFLRSIQIHSTFIVMSLEEIGTPNKKSA